jgi:hypothetical protein
MWLLAAAASTPEEAPTWALQYGAAGAFLFCMLMDGWAFRWLLDRHAAQMEKRDDASAAALKVVADANERTCGQLAAQIKDLAGEIKDGFDHIHQIIERRETQQQGLFDKQLDVVVKVADGMGMMSTQITDNTREIAELKAAVREVQQAVRLRPPGG